MKNRERLVNTLNFSSVDRMPMIEWATWWQKTTTRWVEEGCRKTVMFSNILGWIFKNNIGCLIRLLTVRDQQPWSRFN